MREFNSYFNAHHIDIDRNHPFYLTLNRLSSEMERVNDDLYEMQSSSRNPPLAPDPTVTSLHSLDGFKRDLLYELLPSMSSNCTTESISPSRSSNVSSQEVDHLDADSEMVALCESFIKFTNFPRCTVLDHLWYISNLCHFRDVLDSFLLHHTQSVHRIHPSRTSNRYDSEYDDDSYDDDHDDEDEEDSEYDDEPPFHYRDDSAPHSRRRRRVSSVHHKSSVKPPLDEREQSAFYMKRLHRIYQMDLGQFGIFGVDQHLKAQLKRTLLSRGLHPSLMSSKNSEKTKNAENIENDGDSKNVSVSDFDGESESESKSISKSTQNDENEIEVVSQQNGARQSPHRRHSLSIEHHKGILLHGPPGTGKTMLAKSLQHILLVADDNVSVVNGPEIEDIYIGQTERNIRNLFERAKADHAEWGAFSPLHLVIFDEMDSIAKKRDSSSHSKVYDRSVQQLLSCLDGAASMDNVVVIGTTNRYQDIDPALLRPGRFGVHILMALPDEEQRRELLLKCGHCWDVIDAEQVTMEWLVSLTDGLSHSDIAALLSQSKMNAVERVIEEWFVEQAANDGESEQNDGHIGDKKEEEHCHDLYDRIRGDFRVTATDIMCALDEIRINQVHRDRNQRQHGADFAFDISF